MSWLCQVLGAPFVWKASTQLYVRIFPEVLVEELAERPGVEKYRARKVGTSKDEILSNTPQRGRGLKEAVPGHSQTNLNMQTQCRHYFSTWIFRLGYFSLLAFTVADNQAPPQYKTKIL